MSFNPKTYVEGGYLTIDSIIDGAFVHFTQEPLAAQAIYTKGLLADANARQGQFNWGQVEGRRIRMSIPPMTTPVISDRERLTEDDFSNIVFTEKYFEDYGMHTAALQEATLAFSPGMGISEEAWVLSASKVVYNSLGMAINERLLRYAYLNTYHQVGSPGAAFVEADLARASTLLDNLGVPEKTRNAIVNFRVREDIALQYRALINANAVPAADQAKAYHNLQLASSIYGFTQPRYYHSLPIHTVGNYTHTEDILTDGVQDETYTGGSKYGIIKIKNAPASRTGLLKAGDIFTIGVLGEANAVLNVSYFTKTLFGTLAQFVVYEDVNTDSDGKANVKVGRLFRSSGDLQDISESVKGNLKITITGAANSQYKVGFASWEGAYLWSPINLTPIPEKKSITSMGIKDIPFSLRGTAEGDFLNPGLKHRYDTLYTFGVGRPEAAVRLALPL